MNTVKKNKLLLNILITIFFAIQSTEAQVSHENRRLIYRILVFHKHNPNPTILTGFKPRGYNGILTALHGFTANDITNIIFYPGDSQSDKEAIELDDFDFAGINIKEDLVFFKCKKDLWKGGFEIVTNYKANKYEKLYVYGYPRTKQLQGGEHATQDPSLSSLGRMLAETPMARTIQARKSPDSGSVVIRLPVNAIQPGHSGGPVFNREGKVVGIANGGFIVGSGTEVGTMAIIPTIFPKQTYPEPKRKALFQEINRNPATFLSSGTEINDSKDDPIALKFPDSKPFFTIGGTLSRPFKFVQDGIKADMDFRKMNGRFDGYFEFGTKNWFSLGAYLSSSFLQYKILRAFDLAIPLAAQQKVRVEKPRFLYGLQGSYIFSRGVIHNSYIGAGFFPVWGDDDNARLRFNYRGYVGYRLYPNKYRRFGVEIRAMFVGQNIAQSRWRPTLGIARPERTIQPLNQFYLCGGLTYSIYRHD